MDYLVISKVSDWVQEMRPHCLLVYSPTHDAHIDVMTRLAIYLREREINAMLDVMDVQKEVDKAQRYHFPYDPKQWSTEAYKKADVIIVVASPVCANATVTQSVYKHFADKNAMEMIIKKRRSSDKRYLALQLPYCHESDMPKEASKFTLFQIPEDLNQLVNKIHRTEYTGVSSTIRERNLIQSIDLAKKIITNEESINEPESLEKLTDPTVQQIQELAIDVDQKDESRKSDTSLMAYDSSDYDSEYTVNYDN